MAKLTLTDESSGYQTTTQRNANYAAIEAALENTLSRDGTSPNSMLSNLDMNSNRVINLAAPTASSDAARWVDVASAVGLDTAVPNQTGNGGKVLATIGSTLVWHSAAIAVDTVSAMKALTGLADGAYVQVAGYHTKGDGGGGDFIYNSASSATSDDGLVFTPTTLSGRFIRSHGKGDINLLWFGAKGDWVTNNYSALQAAVNATFKNPGTNYGGGCLHVPEGYFMTSQAVLLPNAPFHIRGEGGSSVLYAQGCTLFNYPHQFSLISHVSDMYILGNNTAGTEFFNSNPTNPAWVFTQANFTRLRIGGFPRIFNIPNAQLCNFDDCVFDGANTGTVFYIHPTANGQAANSNRVRRCQVTGTAVTTVDFDPGAFAANCNNWLFDACDFQQSGAIIPLTIKDSQWIVRSCEFENSSGAGTIDIVTSDTLSANFNVIEDCIFAGSASTGHVRIYRTGVTQESYYTTVRNCNASPSLPIVWIGKGRSTLIQNCAGTVTGSGGEFTVEIAGSNNLAAAAISGDGMKVKSTLWTSGTGTPEGAVTAIVGSLYTRLDGGASTTLYVKESGTGNTGWVAK